MSLAEAIVLAIVEGLTEFLPVSSTGHMIIASSIMGIASSPFVRTFSIAIQLGTLLSGDLCFGPRRVAISGHYYWRPRVWPYKKSCCRVLFLPGCAYDVCSHGI